MEHYRSTLATTAFAVLGLVAAARILHPGNYEDQPRRARPVAAQVDTAPAVAWTDPPRELKHLGTPSVDAMALAPRMTIPLPPGATMAPTLPAEMTANAGQPQRVGASRTRKAAQRASRVRQAVLVRERASEAAPPQAVVSPVAKPAGGPLDDLLRDLGLGRDSDG